MKNLIHLAFAIRQFEGWQAGDGSKARPGTISWRNNNPGNLRSSPFSESTQGGFAYFKDAGEGMAALIWDLWCKCTGNTGTGLTPRSTLADLIAIWAPASDGNSPEAYAEAVSEILGVPPTTELSYFTE